MRSYLIPDILAVCTFNAAPVVFFKSIIFYCKNVKYIYSQLLSPLLSLKCNILACFGKIKINGLLKGFEWGLFHFKSKILFASLAPDARAP